MSRTGPNASAEVIAPNPNIDEAFRTQRGSFFFKRMAGMLVLHKLEEALVHSGDITLNICFFKVGKR